MATCARSVNKRAAKTELLRTHLLSHDPIHVNIEVADQAAIALHRLPPAQGTRGVSAATRVNGWSSKATYDSVTESWPGSAVVISGTSGSFAFDRAICGPVQAPKLKAQKRVAFAEQPVSLEKPLQKAR